MTDLPTPTQPPVALRTALVGAIGRRRSRIRFRMSAAVATAVALVAALFGGGVFTGGPERVLAIDDGSEWVTVRILDGEAGAAEMTQELQEAGIDGEVQSLPSTPDYVGRWMGFALGRESPRRPCDLPEDAPPDLECANPPLLAGDDVRFGEDAFQIRRDAIYLLGETRTIFYVGREPEPGEERLDGPPKGADMGFVYPATVPTESGTARTR
jgi:hypothetical protein